MSKIRPLNDAIFFKEKVAELKQTESGIFLPEVSRPKFILGDVIAVGPGTDKGMQVKVGDVIVAPIRAVSDVEVDGQQLFVVTQNSVIAVVE